jgi:hypothetical protein
MIVLPKEVTEVITGTAVTGQPWSLRCHVVEPVLDQHRRGHCCCRQKTILAAGGRVAVSRPATATLFKPAQIKVASLCTRFTWTPPAATTGIGIVGGP